LVNEKYLIRFVQAAGKLERGEEASSTKLALDIDGRNKRGKDINCKIIRKR